MIDIGVKSLTTSSGTLFDVAAAVSVLIEVNNNQEPSCGPLATAEAPMKVEPPGLFSTMTEFPSLVLNWEAIALAIISVLAPGENGTMIRIIGGIETCCAWAKS
jgi:hypothetical protein